MEDLMMKEKRKGCGCGCLGCLLPFLCLFFFILFLFSTGNEKGQETCVDVPTISGIANQNTEENAKVIYTYFRKNFGATPEGASGVLGCLQFESQLDSTAENPSSGAYGIAQWLGGRLTRLEQLAQETGKKKSDLTVQLQLLSEELQDSSQWHLEQRNAMADSWYAKFGSSDPVANYTSENVVAEDGNILVCDSSGSGIADGDILEIAKRWLGWFHYDQVHPAPDLGSDLKNPNKEGRTDCSGFVWLVLNKAGYHVPANMQWYTGSMASDARGSQQYLQAISANDAQAGDIIIVNQGGGAGSNGHTGILTEKWKGNETKIIQEGGNGDRVNIEAFGTSFTSLISGSDICFARPIKK